MAALGPGLSSRLLENVLVSSTGQNYAQMHPTLREQQFPVLRHSLRFPEPQNISASKPSLWRCPVASTSSNQISESSTMNEIAVPTSFEYNQNMKRHMANPYEYHHHLGMYYTRIDEDLIVGSQPQSPKDIEHLVRKEGVGAILNLQQDHDIAYWNIDISPIIHRCNELGVRHYRRPAVDFDGHSLRQQLPRMVAVIERNIQAGRSVYVHCTAGLGRAPACAIAYLFWFKNMDLESAYHFLTSKRPCGPKWEAIRGATYDLAKNSHNQPPFEHLPSFAFTDVAPWERDLIKKRVKNLY